MSSTRSGDGELRLIVGSLAGRGSADAAAGTAAAAAPSVLCLSVCLPRACPAPRLIHLPHTNSRNGAPGLRQGLRAPGRRPGAAGALPGRKPRVDSIRRGTGRTAASQPGPRQRRSVSSASFRSVASPAAYFDLPDPTPNARRALQPEQQPPRVSGSRRRRPRHAPRHCPRLVRCARVAGLRCN